MAKKPVNPQSTSEVPSKDEYGERLRLMETQLASILQRSKASQLLLELQHMSWNDKYCSVWLGAGSSG